MFALQLILQNLENAKQPVSENRTNTNNISAIQGFIMRKKLSTTSEELHEIPLYVLLMIGNIEFQQSEMLEKIIREVFTSLEITKQLE